MKLFIFTFLISSLLPALSSASEASSNKNTSKSCRVAFDENYNLELPSQIYKGLEDQIVLLEMIRNEVDVLLKTKDLREGPREMTRWKRKNLQNTINELKSTLNNFTKGLPAKPIERKKDLSQEELDFIKNEVNKVFEPENSTLPQELNQLNTLIPPSKSE